MNARTRDGIVHALRSAILDEDGCHSVLCGLRGQEHVHDKPEHKATAAEPTEDPVSCIACLDEMERSRSRSATTTPMRFSAVPWNVATRKGEEPN